jgi:hypothetical protein
VWAAQRSEGIRRMISVETPEYFARTAVGRTWTRNDGSKDAGQDIRNRRRGSRHTDQETRIKYEGTKRQTGQSISQKAQKVSICASSLESGQRDHGSVKTSARDGLFHVRPRIAMALIESK